MTNNISLYYIKKSSNYVLTRYYAQKVELLFFLALVFFLIIFAVNKTIGTLLYFQYFFVGALDLVELIFLHLISSIEGLFSFCALVAVAISTHQLCKTSELPSYFAAGISAKFVFWIVFKFTLFLGFLSFILIAFIRPIFSQRIENLKTTIVQKGEFQFYPNTLNPIEDYFFLFKEKNDNFFFNVLMLAKNDPLKEQIIFAKKAKINTYVAESLFVFELKEGSIFQTDPLQNIQFKELLYPVQILGTVQLESIENRVLQKTGRKHTQYNFFSLLQKSQKYKNIDKEEENYYFARAVFLITRSLHNIALPLVGLWLGFFYSRFRSKFLFIKFFLIYAIYYFFVIQLENSALEQKISLWWNFLPPILISIFSYFAFLKKT